MITSIVKNSFKLVRNTTAATITFSDQFITDIALNQEDGSIAAFTGLSFKESRDLGRRAGAEAATWVNTKIIDPTDTFVSETWDDMFDDSESTKPASK